LQVDPGFHAENVVTATLDMSGAAYEQPGSHQIFFQHLMEQIRAMPRVQAVGGVLAVPLSAGFLQNQPVTLEGHGFAAAANSPMVDPLAVTPEYFRTMSIPLRMGRAFSDRDGPGRVNVAIVNEQMARRYWPGQNPLGKRLVLGSQERYAHAPGGEPSWISVVGVVADVRAAGLGAEVRPEIYFSYWQYPWSTAQLVVRASGDPLKLASAIRGAALTLDRHQPMTQLRSMEEIVADSVAQPRFRTVILGLFALMALLLAAVGIYGVASYSAVQRTHEIGIRLALGAHPNDVFRLVLGGAMTITAIGLLVGVAGALFLQRLIEGLLYGVTSTDPVTLVTVAVLFSAVALTASGVPALRAMRVEPLVALHHD
jgi:putative ABC transport system permease protein